MKIKRTERGWAGHYIFAENCAFVRNTLLQKGKTFVVISTVGCYRTTDDKGNYSQPQSIGYDRFYETMSFYSDENDSIYHDADVSKEISSVKSKWFISGKEMEEKKNEIDNVANKMHEDYVSKVESMLINGEL